MQSRPVAETEPNSGRPIENVVHGLSQIFRLDAGVVLNEGASITAKELREYCKTQLAAYKVPRQIEFLDELPKSSMMKILRRDLREREIRREGGS